MDNKEIDRQIAEKVFGFCLCGKGTKVYLEIPPEGSFDTAPHESIWHCKEHKKPILPPRFQREYSTNIAHAFEVVEKLQNDGFYVKLRGPFIRPDDWRWYCYFEYHGTTDTHPLWKAFADTPAMAICLAALEAAKEKE